jgi:hypothetical protein
MSIVIQVMLTLLAERTGSLQFNGEHYPAPAWQFFLLLSEVERIPDN